MLEKYKYIEPVQLIELLKGKDKVTIQNEAIYCLTYRMITKSECKEVLNHFGIYINHSIEAEVFNKVEMFNTGLTINELPSMNYVETKIFLNRLNAKGMCKETIKDELYNLWEEGRIKGFDFRYAVEAMGESIPERFTREALLTGRYYL